MSTISVNKPKPSPVDVVIWTSSHGTPFHHLPQELEKIYSKNVRMKAFLNKPLFNAKPGRLMNSQFMFEFTHDFERIDPSTTRLSIILMGDNDLRSLGIDGCSRVFNNSKKLISLHESSHHALLLMGLLPSPGTHLQTSGFADYCDFRVKKEVEKAHEKGDPEKLGFVRTSVFFNDREGHIKHKIHFCLDGVHLKPEGARCLARNLLNKSVNFMQVISGSSVQGELQQASSAATAPMPPLPSQRQTSHQDTNLLF